MLPAVLIRKQALDDAHSVTVWRQPGHYNGQSVLTYKKVWEGPVGVAAQGWLSWGLHENFLLTLLAGRGVTRAVTTMDIHKDAHRIELLTLDAGPELQRDWLEACPQAWTDQDLVKLGYHTLQALVQIHREGVVHGDLKADNICVPALSHPNEAGAGVDWQGLKLIDFAFSLSRDYPLRFVLPTDTQKMDYLPEFYKRAIERSQQLQQPQLVQKVCCAEIDLFSLGCMLQQLATPSKGRYPGTTALAQECLRVGAKKPRWRWLSKRFEAETLRLEQTALDWLHAQGVPGDGMRFSILPRPDRDMVTPLRNPALPTPMLATWPAANTASGTASSTALATPLLVPPPRTSAAPPATAMAQVEAQVKAQVEDQPVQATRPQQGPPDARPVDSRRPIQSDISVWARLRWPAIYLMLLMGFAAIDRAYLSTQLLLSDTGYALALLGIACALPMGLGVVVQARRPARRGERICSGLTVVLWAVGIFHGLSAWWPGLTGWQELQIAVPWLGVACLWILRPRLAME